MDQNPNWFYPFLGIMDRLKIPNAIMILFLVNIGYKYKNRDMKLVFSEPISYKELYKKFANISSTALNDIQWAEELRIRLYQLK